MKMLTNYLATSKTHNCFRNSSDLIMTRWGLIERACYANIHNKNKKKQMRRYAKHADRKIWYREVQQQLKDEQDYYDAQIEEAIQLERLLDKEYDSYYDDYRDRYNYDDPWMYDDYDGPAQYAETHPLFKTIQDMYLDGKLALHKYYKIVDVLREHD